MNQLRVVDPAAYSASDRVGTLAALGPWWRQLVDGRDEADALVLTQAADVARVVAHLAATLGVPVTRSPDDDLGAVLDWLDAAAPAVAQAAAAIRRTEGAPAVAERDAAYELTRAAKAERDAGAMRGGGEAPAALPAPRPRITSGGGDAVGQAVVAAVDGILDAGDRLRAAGVLPGSVTGVVAALHQGDGGVPKRAVDSVMVDGRGVVGDRQAARRHHGRPWQALCLWSGEVIDAFAAAAAAAPAHGHDLAPGRAGENVTVRGLPWAEVRSGVRLRLGEVLAEVTVFALPCAKNARWFTGGRFELMHHDQGPVSRAYALVLEPGRIRVGDAAVLEPDRSNPTASRRAAGRPRG